MSPERAPAPPFDIFNIYFDKIYDPTMHLCFSLDGRIDEERFRSAFILVLESDPYLSSRYTEENGVAYWERIPREKYEKAFAIHTVDGGDLAPPDVPPGFVDVYSGPPAAAAIFRAEGKGDVVTVSIHHGCSDVHGLIDLASLLFTVYRKLGEDPAYVPEFRGWYDRDANKILDKFSEDEIKKEAGRDKRIVDRWVFPFDYTGRGTPRYAFRIFPEERLPAVKEFGKRYGATVNDVLIAAYILALIELRDDPSDLDNLRGVLSSADMRRHLRRTWEYSVENLSIAEMIEIVAVEGEELGDAVRKVAEITKGRKAGAFGAFDIMFYEDLYDSGLGAVRNFFNEILSGYDTTTLKNPVFSNIGVIDDGRFDPGSVMNIEYALFLPVICWPPGFLLCASTWKGSLSIQCGYEEGPYSAGTIDKFLDIIDRLLP
ncbi:condensation domain protein [Methanolacinia petrolearia DSM 11571]|uniref:Condensation domain protein n=1 Tax=Methanolacinia petrolearia (strain DSM 11571 / OCM 486 / SEBR 4847) TaxID=679926 RepID=E1RKH5_METP4|nr:condensation domain-containing protein [Methanolacinia petrolearia]ADN35828.1 condensation domain protein [Methanolacinia petrolearia DSM 11571]